MGEVLCSTENSPFVIIDHIHAKINRVCCAALAIGKRCMNLRKNKLLQNTRNLILLDLFNSRCKNGKSFPMVTVLQQKAHGVIQKYLAYPLSTNT